MERAWAQARSLGLTDSGSKTGLSPEPVGLLFRLASFKRETNKSMYTTVRPGSDCKARAHLELFF